MKSDPSLPILGLGNDLIEIDRVRKGVEEHGQLFLDRLFTLKEQEYCTQQKDPFPRYAGRFAAKEALVKALGCGFGSKANWLDFEILPDPQGKPEVHLSEEMNNRFNTPLLLITISHCKTFASAVAIWVSDHYSS